MVVYLVRKGKGKGKGKGGLALRIKGPRSLSYPPSAQR
jgi:hypothetical protein